MHRWKLSSSLAFKKVDDELMECAIESNLSGTTATVALILEDHELFIANVGDSRAVMGSVGKSRR